MTNNRMTALTLSGPADRLDEAIEHYIMGQDIHLEDAVSFLRGLRRLEKPAEADPYAPLLREAERLMTALDIEKDYEPFDDGGYTAENCEAYLASLAEKLAGAEKESAALCDRRQAGEKERAALRPFASVSERLDELVALQYVHCRFGRLHPHNCAPLFAEAETVDGLYLQKTDENDEYVWLLALSTRDESDRMDAMLSRFGFERIAPPTPEHADGTAAELLARLDAQAEQDGLRLAAMEAVRAELCETEKRELLARRCFLTYKSSCFEARQYAGLARGRFYLVGWVESERAEAFAEEFEAQSGFTCIKASAGEITGTQAPVKLKKRRFAGIFDAIVKMYGLPSDGERDPRLFLAVTYTLFFGIMFGDVGQGACLILIGWLVWKKTGGSIWRIFSVCGISSVVFGLVYGSFFGLEKVFPWGGFHVLEGDNLMTTLIAAVALGVLVLLVCMIHNILNSLSRRDYQSALFGPNGVCGMIFYAAVVALVVSLFTGLFAFPTWAIWLCIVLPLALIWVGAPLGKLLAGDPEWKAEGIGSVLMDGFFEIFEAALSYLSNTMSFLRVGAFAISHAGMMMVVYLIGETAGTAGNILVAIFGNILVAGLEAGLASIQIIRLQFYEMFGRYYSGRGRAFTSLQVQYK